MSYLVSQQITDIRSEFEGGNSLSLDWLSYLRRGANNVLDNINPENLKRRSPIFGGVANNLAVYYCPNDVLVPSALYRQPHDRVPCAKYMPPAQFYFQNKVGSFTIEHINGVRFLIMRQSIPYRATTLDAMDVVSSKISDQTLSINQFDFISGTGALQRTFTERGGTAFTADHTTETFTDTAHGLVNGDRVRVYSATTLPAGLSEDISYFVVEKTDDTFKLSLTEGGSAVAITSNGTGVHKWYSATTNEISDNLSSVLDISDINIALIPMVFATAGNIAGVELVLETDDENYYTMNSSQDSVGDNFIDGLNFVRFTKSSAVETGSVNEASIAKWRLRVWTDAGTTETVIIDKITLQQTAHYYFEYYSNRLFIDGTTGAWKDTPTVTSDRINLDRDTRDILHYETVLLIAQGNTKIRQNGSGFDNFTAQLARKYQQHWSRHPSSEAPMSYNNLHDSQRDLIPQHLNTGGQPEYNVDYDNLDTIGTQFVDNETPAGTIDGVNAVFALAYTPNPTNSLMIWLNGTYLTQGVEYTLSGRTITFAVAPDVAYAGLPFIAFYRYSA